MSFLKQILFDRTYDKLLTYDVFFERSFSELFLLVAFNILKCRFLIIPCKILVITVLSDENQMKTRPKSCRNVSVF